MNKCETCQYFERGKWHKSIAADEDDRCGGQCKMLHRILEIENSSLWAIDAIQVTDTFGCVLWEKKQS